MNFLFLINKNETESKLSLMTKYKSSKERFKNINTRDINKQF